MKDFRFESNELQQSVFAEKYVLLVGMPTTIEEPFCTFCRLPLGETIPSAMNLPSSVAGLTRAV